MPKLFLHRTCREDATSDRSRPLRILLVPFDRYGFARYTYKAHRRACQDLGVRKSIGHKLL